MDGQEWGRFASASLAWDKKKYWLLTTVNAALRCAWTLGISRNAGYSEAFALLLQVIEVCRRSMWLFPRIEWCVAFQLAIGCTCGLCSDLHLRFCIYNRIPPLSLRVNRYVVEVA